MDSQFEIVYSSKKLAIYNLSEDNACKFEDSEEALQTDDVKLYGEMVLKSFASTLISVLLCVYFKRTFGDARRGSPVPSSLKILARDVSEFDSDDILKLLASSIVLGLLFNSSDWFLHNSNTVAAYM